MKKIKRNVFAFLTGLAIALGVALSAYMNANAFVAVFDSNDCSTVGLPEDFSEGNNHFGPSFCSLDCCSPVSSILGSRRPGQQMQFRHQRGNSLLGFGGRDAVLTARTFGSVLETLRNIDSKYSPRSLIVFSRSAKEYYVFTLERILC